MVARTHDERVEEGLDSLALIDVTEKEYHLGRLADSKETPRFFLTGAAYRGSRADRYDLEFPTGDPVLSGKNIGEVFFVNDNTIRYRTDSPCESPNHESSKPD
jgi:hypothetical protein